MRMVCSQIVSKVKTAVENLLSVHITRASRHGHYDCLDITRSGCRVSLVFDVGANIGTSARRFAVAFPRATIHCFEPVKDTFETLKNHTARYANIHCHHLALGAEDGQATVYITGDSTGSSLVRSACCGNSERVEVQTVDHFAITHKISRIDFLKIDTEGFDLEVLKGAKYMLSADSIPFVVVETGFHPGRAKHVLFDDIRSYLLPLGYGVFGIYDQQLEWSGPQSLRFANVCFCKESAFIRECSVTA